MNTDKNVSNFTRFDIIIQYYLDRVTPYLTFRWLFNLFLLIIIFLRIYFAQGYYIIAYGLGIFLLNQFILFLTPRQDLLLLNIDEDGDAPSLPTRSTDEFRPFVRRLPEFKFWYITFKALVISLILTLFSIFDIPVFWPVLVIYFFILFALTMRERILHMIHYKYVPFSYGKVRYAGKNPGQQGVKLSTN
jgi:hypothetical protein